MAGMKSCRKWRSEVGKLNRELETVCQERWTRQASTERSLNVGDSAHGRSHEQGRDFKYRMGRSAHRKRRTRHSGSRFRREQSPGFRSETMSGCSALRKRVWITNPETFLIHGTAMRHLENCRRILSAARQTECRI